LLTHAFDGDPTLEPDRDDTATDDVRPALRLQIDRLSTLASDSLADELIELDRRADALEDRVRQNLPRTTGDLNQGRPPIADVQTAAVSDNQPDPITAELLDAQDDPVGALSWWMTPNIYLGQSPMDAARSGLVAQVHYAAQQSLDDSW